jgi:hypothetical protein
MGERILEGGFIVARKIFKSDIWIKDPLYLKIWIWIVGKANHSNREKKGRTYKRGEFVTTYNDIIKNTAYYYNRKHIYPSIKQIRIILKWLETEGMIRVEPLKSQLSLTGADSTARTRAYVGIKIIVIKYDTYQDLDNYRDRDKGRPSVQQGHNNNNVKNDNTPADIFSLRERYSDQKLIDDAFAAIASTRKSNKVADSVLLAQLQKWERYPVEQVESGMRIYLDKGCADQGKDEKYLLGIIRNQKVGVPKEQSTGSSLLDAYYANAN